MHVFKHPNYYKELRKRNKSDQAISFRAETSGTSVRPGPGLKVSSSKHQASSVITKDQPWFGATSVMCPAPKQNNECKDCRQCWNPEIKNVSYGKH